MYQIGELNNPSKKTIMKKLVFTAIAALFTVATFAQTTPAATTPTIAPATTTVEKTQMKDLRQDVRAYDNKKAEAKHAINKGNLTAAQTDLAAAKVDKQDIKADAKNIEKPKALPIRLN